MSTIRLGIMCIKMEVSVFFLFPLHCGDQPSGCVSLSYENSIDTVDNTTHALFIWSMCGLQKYPSRTLTMKAFLALRATEEVATARTNPRPSKLFLKFCHAQTGVETHKDENSDDKHEHGRTAEADCWCRISAYHTPSRMCMKCSDLLQMDTPLFHLEAL